MPRFEDPGRRTAQAQVLALPQKHLRVVRFDVLGNREVGQQAGVDEEGVLM